ncbi:unnamed protein product, partial [Ectocarpus sp. 12 AP-2014]
MTGVIPETSLPRILPPSVLAMLRAAQVFSVVRQEVIRVSGSLVHSRCCSFLSICPSVCRCLYLPLPPPPLSGSSRSSFLLHGSPIGGDRPINPSRRLPTPWNKTHLNALITSTIVKSPKMVATEESNRCDVFLEQVNKTRNLPTCCFFYLQPPPTAPSSLHHVPLFPAPLARVR